jgi:putative colanic acid biosynthesis glycosyltransferase
MKVLQINSGYNIGSTGRIAESIGKKVIDIGGESVVAYGRNANAGVSKTFKIGNKTDQAWHLINTRVFDTHGFHSTGATKELIVYIKSYNPDVIHLHNLHGYYLNIEVLFNYLATKDIPIVWTLHDCWSFTGHCAYYDAVGCYKWETECHSCPQTKKYPASFLMDRSRNNFLEKRELFNSLSNLILVPVSNWLKGEVEKSFLKQKHIRRIYNGVDINTFRPVKDSNIREKYGIGNMFMMIGVASIWTSRKGLEDYIELSNKLNDNEVIVLVGLSEKQLSQLPSNIIGIKRTENMHELAALYSTSDIILNLSYEETFGLTTVEGMSCGTPGIVYNKTASPELITKEVGFIVEAGNMEQLLNAIATIKKQGKAYYSENCRRRAEEYFNKDDRYQEYLELYKEMLNE